LWRNGARSKTARWPNSKSPLRLDSESKDNRIRKLSERGPPGEEEKVRLAPAIRRAESHDGNRGSPQPADDASPLMLATNRAVRIPDPVEAGVGSEVVNVPVRSRRQLPMARDASPDASRPQGAADINVETASKPQRPELPDLHQPLPGKEKGLKRRRRLPRSGSFGSSLSLQRQAWVKNLQVRKASLGS
jgi:hypothetical protein